MSERRKNDAKRIHIAREKGRKLAHRAKFMDQLSVDETAALADDFAALMAEYPDVYWQPPVSVEALRAHVQTLRDADEAARKAQAESEEAIRQLEQARRTYDAALRELERAPVEPDEPG